MPGVVEKTAYERQVFGQLSLRAPFQFDAEQFGGRVADVESARFERRPHPVGMAAGEPFRPGAASFGAVEAASDVGECPSAVAALQREEPPFDPDALGAEQPPGLGEGESLFAGRDLRGDEQRRAVPQPLLRGVLREGRSAPAAAVVGASAAIGGDAFRVAEAGGVFGGGKLDGEFLGRIADGCVHAAKLVVSAGIGARSENYFPAFCLFRGKPLSLSPDLVFRSSCGGRNEKGIGCKSRTVPLL